MFDIIDSFPGWRLLSYSIGASAALFLTVVLYGVYNVLFHPLRKYPGPLLWRAYRLSHVVSVQRGDVHRQLKHFHEKYGPIVRYAPNELSYANGAAWKDIYGNRPGHLPFKRSATFFRKLSADDPESIMGPNEEAHARMRRAFANSFSEKSLKDQSPTVERYVSAMIEQLKAPVAGRLWKERTVDLVDWLIYVAFDISGDLSFGESFDCVKNGKAHYWVEISHDFGKGLAALAAINHYPPMHKLLRYVLPQKVMQRQIDHRKMSTAKTRARLALDTDRPDFVTPAKKYADKKDALTMEEWELNMAIVIFAGSETTATALSAILHELVQNLGAMHRLTREIRDTFEVEGDISVASTGGLPYLNAVINEGLRLGPPVVTGVPREVPEGGDTICDQFVPGGTFVAFNQFSANRQSYNFRNPNSFIPERFLDLDPKANDMSAFQPFGIGRHSCIGIKLAYGEMRYILARLLFAFDISLADPNDKWDWGEQETHIFWEKRPLRVKLRQREAVPFQR
ncbi:cytochrome P450 [Lophiostoma macrostomum CBS 122681]|uniref:Cytochrome P450 n=1 Tax=Lophiostoma macrostomum CBS 122681 TaxID=1314788 RepID=A0A6A6T2R2_9PLEO|nr:cytochrome P450 [Lophiostoma macrostomum CBS 122681]